MYCVLRGQGSTRVVLWRGNASNRPEMRISQFHWWDVPVLGDRPLVHRWRGREAASPFRARDDCCRHTGRLAWCVANWLAPPRAILHSELIEAADERLVKMYRFFWAWGKGQRVLERLGVSPKLPLAGQTY